MKAIGRLLTSLLLLGNMVLLASLSLHVVWAPGKLALVPKDHLTLLDTYRDVRQWTPADLQSHPSLVTRLTDAGRLDLVAHIASPSTASLHTQTSSVLGDHNANPAITPAIDVPTSLVTQVQVPAKPAATKNPLVKPAVVSEKSAPTTRPAAGDAGGKSIFDFGQ